MHRQDTSEGLRVRYARWREAERRRGRASAARRGSSSRFGLDGSTGPGRMGFAHPGNLPGQTRRERERFRRGCGARAGAPSARRGSHLPQNPWGRLGGARLVHGGEPFANPSPEVGEGSTAVARNERKGGRGRGPPSRQRRGLRSTPAPARAGPTSPGARARRAARRPRPARSPAPARRPAAPARRGSPAGTPRARRSPSTPAR
jgi:hypothetical protein